MKHNVLTKDDIDYVNELLLTSLSVSNEALIPCMCCTCGNNTSSIHGCGP